MSEEDYKYLSTMPKFLIEEVQVCQDCYLQLVWTQNISSGMHQLHYIKKSVLKPQRGHNSISQEIIFEAPRVTLQKAKFNLKQIDSLYDVMYKSQQAKDNFQRVNRISVRQV